MWKYGATTIFKKIKFNKEDLKNAKLVDRYGIYLPNHANLSSDDINYVTKEFKLVADPFKF